MSNATDPTAVSKEVEGCLKYLESLASLARVRQQGNCPDWFLVAESPDDGEDVGTGIYTFWHNAQRLVAYVASTTRRFDSVEPVFSQNAASDDLLTCCDCHGASFHELAVALCRSGMYKLAPAFESGAELVLWMETVWKAQSPPSIQDALSAVGRWSLNPAGALQVLDQSCLPAIDFNWLQAGIRKELSRVSVGCNDQLTSVNPECAESSTRSTKGPTVNQRMLEELQADHESRGLSASQWAKRLRCSKSVVVDSETWKTLQMGRNTIASDNACTKRRGHRPTS